MHKRSTSYFALCFFTFTIVALNNVSADDVEISSAKSNFTLIQKYARFAGAAYQDKSSMQDICVKYGYTLNQVKTIAGVEVFYFMATNPKTKTIMISVRGTSNIENALVDVDLKLVPDQYTGIKLHNGFSQSAQAIFKEIQPTLNRHYTIITTGHSLGGAIALILAMYLDTDGFNVGPIITFGQPKVTNVQGAYKFRHLDLTRVVTPTDLVPLVPPIDPLDINNLDIYWHLGRETILFPGKYYSFLEGLASMLRGISFFTKQLSEENLQAHQMTKYLGMVSEKILDNRMIPYDDREKYLEAGKSN